MRCNASILAMAMMVACGCGAAGGTEGTTGTGSGTGTTETGMPTTGGVATGSSTSDTGSDASSTGSDGGSDGTCGFICSDTDEPGERMCDVFAQDCPEGEKCAPWGDGGSSWNATKCVPVTGDGEPGEPCTAPTGGVSGLDDCAEGVYCWDVDAESHGVCIELCGGSVDVPVCETELTHCEVLNENVLNICYPDCDPIAQGCLFDTKCVPSADEFVCGYAGQFNYGLFDLCDFVNDCEAGLLCSDVSWASECDPEANGCCLPLCDLGAPELVCPGVGQSCVSFYEPGMAPAKYEHVGVCRIPD